MACDTVTRVATPVFGFRRARYKYASEAPPPFLPIKMWRALAPPGTLPLLLSFLRPSHTVRGSGPSIYITITTTHSSDAAQQHERRIKHKAPLVPMIGISFIAVHVMTIITTAYYLI